VRWLTRWHLRRRLAILVMLGLVAAFLQAAIPALVSQFDALVQDLPGDLASLQRHETVVY
jgi:predicted PurR-regulated permease PerM